VTQVCSPKIVHSVLLIRSDPANHPQTKENSTITIDCEDKCGLIAEGPRKVHRADLLEERGDDESPCLRPGRDPARYAGIGSGRIRESEPDNELAENKNAKQHGVGRHKPVGEAAIPITSSPDEYRREALLNQSQSH
jgi:hypothetical protein